MEIIINSIFNVGDRFFFINNNTIGCYRIKQIQYSGNTDENESHDYIKYALCRGGSDTCAWTASEQELLKAIYEDYRLFRTKQDAVKHIVDQL